MNSACRCGTYSQILFTTDGGDGASDAFDHVLDIAVTHDATVRLLYVADTTQPSLTRIGGEVIDTLEREGERIVREAADRAQQVGSPLKPRSCRVNQTVRLSILPIHMGSILSSCRRTDVRASNGFSSVVPPSV